jgi:hypothetical protein
MLKMFEMRLFQTEFDISEINMLLDMSRNKPHPNIIIYNELLLKPKIYLVSEYSNVSFYNSIRFI